MAYVDGFILAVPKDRLAEYRKFARKAGKIWRDLGALEYREWVAEDVDKGKLTSFPRAVKLKPDETVVFAWIVYKSRKDRDRINKQAINDPRLASVDPTALPFCGKRMIYGGFDPLVAV